MLATLLRMARRKLGGDALRIAIMFVIAVAFFWPATLAGRFLIMHDAWCYSFPLRQLAWERLRRGEIPAWTSGIFSGYPMLGMSQLGLGYPITWGYLFDGPWGEQLYILAPFVCAPIFTYLYLRVVGRSREASLLAALSFGYGGFIASPIGHSGVLSNGFMWAPLALWALEKARHAPFSMGLVGVGVAYGMAVLSGIGQGFVYAGVVIASYGVFLALAPGAPVPWRAWHRWRATVMAAGGMIAGAALAAFQILETLRVHEHSVRSELSYEVFSQGSAPLGQVLRSVVAPFHHLIGDVTAYVTPLVVVLAVVAVFSAVRAREPRTLFWTAVALAAFFLMGGNSTPLYRVVHHIPFVNQFRVPPRHAAEWTLALSVLGANGWDWVASRVRAGTLHHLAWRLAAVGLVALGIAAAFRWNQLLPSQHEATLGQYLAGKALLTLFVLLAAALAFAIDGGRLRSAICAGVVLLACLAEPYVLLDRWWFPHTKTRADLVEPSPTTAFLLKHDPRTHRAYSYLFAFGEQARRPKRADGPNLTGMLGLSEVGGYEPLILSRYSEALGGASLFGMGPGWDTPPDSGPGGAFNSRSRALDVLNATFVVRRQRPGEYVVPPAWEDTKAQDRLVIDVGDPGSRPLLARGWSGDESLGQRSGAWTNGRSSVVKLYLFPSAASYDLRLVAAAYAPAAPVDVTARVNRMKLGTFSVEAPFAERTLRIGPGILEEGRNTLVLEFSRAVKPQKVDPASADQRELALFVDIIALTPIR